MNTSDATPLLSHLLELRSRLVRIVLTMLLVFVLLFFWAGELYHLLALPVLKAMPAGSTMIASNPIDPLMAPMKVALLTTFLVTLPHTLYQLWAFVAPGLYRHERRLVLPLIASSTLLFYCGMAFAYFVVLPSIFAFMSHMVPEGVTLMPDTTRYLDFVIGMFLAFGAAFEVPVAVVLLVRMRVISLQTLKDSRSYVIVAAFVIAAIVTPPDVMSQLLLAIPLCLLYELGLLAARLVQTPANPDDGSPE